MKTAAEAGVKYDYVVCAHKAIGQSTVPEQIAPAVDAENTTLVIIQNGVGNEEAFRKAFPKTTILTCVVSPYYACTCRIFIMTSKLPDLGWLPPNLPRGNQTY